MFTAIALAAETAGTAAEATSSGGVLASLGINGTLFVFQLINFAVVAAVVWFLILKPVTKKMAERQNIIDESIDNAKKIEANIIMSERKYQEKIDQAKVDANKVIEKAQVAAVEEAEAMKNKAKAEIESVVDQAKKNIKIERTEMMDEIRREAAGMVAAAVEKIISEKMDSLKDGKLVEEALKSLKS